MRPEGLARPQCKSLCGAWAWVLRVGMGGPVLWVRKCALRLMWTAAGLDPCLCSSGPKDSGGAVGTSEAGAAVVAMSAAAWAPWEVASAG